VSTQQQPQARLASEDVIINAPMSYAGSAQRIMRIRRRAPGGWMLAAITVLVILLLVGAWVFVTAWYLAWGLWLVPYRVLRRGARKRKADAMRHRELMGTIQGSAAASAGAIVAATTTSHLPPAQPAVQAPGELIADVDRESTVSELREHVLAGRLTSDEFEERLHSAHRARTRADLDAVHADLPSVPSEAAAASARERD
jgi:hypothetical protein